MKKGVRLVFSIALCLLAGIVGSYFTFPAIPTWYATLIKPTIGPPNWIFGPVWTTLYVLMGISLYLIWQKGHKKKNIKYAVQLFSLQLLLNVLWSVMFFGLQSPLLALLEIVLLWLAIFATIRAFYRLSHTAAYMLIPYLAWVSFATILNGAIVYLNP